MKFNKEKFKKNIKRELGDDLSTSYKLLEEKLKWELILYGEITFSANLGERIKAVIEVIDELLIFYET